MSLFRCLKCDFMRLFHNLRFIKYILVMSIFEFVLFITDDAFAADLPVLYYIIYETSMHVFLIVFPIAFLVFGTCLIEDKEEHYYRQQYMRVSLGNYVLSKSIVNAFASIFSVVLSLFLAALFLGMLKDWNKNIEVVSFLRNTDLAFFYNSGYFVACVLLIGMQLGMLSGLLSSISFFVSSLVNDKIFASVITFISCMVIQYIWEMIDQKGLAFLGYFIVASNGNNFGNHWLLKDFLIMLVGNTVCMLFTWIVLKRGIHFE